MKFTLERDPFRCDNFVKPEVRENSVKVFLISSFAFLRSEDIGKKVPENE